MMKTKSDDAQPLADFLLELDRVTVLLRVQSMQVIIGSSHSTVPLSEAACGGAVNRDKTGSDDAQL